MTDEVIVVRFGNANHAHLTGARFTPLRIVDVADAINFGRLRGEARFPEQFRFFGRTFHQHGEFAANEAFIARQRYAPLQSHQLSFAVVNGALVYFGIQREALAGFFVAVGENNQPFELGAFDKLAEKAMAWIAGIA